MDERVKRPRANTWTKITTVQIPNHPPCDMWMHEGRGLVVGSSVDPIPTERGDEWHVSVARQNRTRASDGDVAFALRHFGLDGAEEDNEGSTSKVRHFWRPIASVLS